MFNILNAIVCQRSAIWTVYLEVNLADGPWQVISLRSFVGDGASRTLFT